MGLSFKCVRYSAIAQILLGCLLVMFGIADRATIYHEKGTFTDRTALNSFLVIPIWTGIWVSSKIFIIQYFNIHACMYDLHKQGFKVAYSIKRLASKLVVLRSSTKNGSHHSVKYVQSAD